MMEVEPKNGESSRSPQMRNGTASRLILPEWDGEWNVNGLALDLLPSSFDHYMGYLASYICILSHEHESSLIILEPLLI